MFGAAAWGPWQTSSVHGRHCVHSLPSWGSPWQRHVSTTREAPPLLSHLSCRLYAERRAPVNHMPRLTTLKERKENIIGYGELLFLTIIISHVVYSLRFIREHLIFVTKNFTWTGSLPRSFGSFRSNLTCLVNLFSRQPYCSPPEQRWVRLKQSYIILL